MAKHVTFTVLFEGANLNYGEGFGNIQALKKISSRGKNFSYISRQALRYDIVRIMNEELGVKLTPIGLDGKVIQFEKAASIKDYPEIDLFGYMKTGKNSNNNPDIRKAVVRLTDAVSIEAYNNDIDFGNNMGLAKRKTGQDNGLFQSEIHKAFYSYTATMDLDKIGMDENTSDSLNSNEKKRRINLFLDAVKILYRDIKGKRENMSPCFIIGGVYDSGNPFFYNRVTLEFHKDKILLNTDIINSVLQTTFNKEPIAKSTKAGYINGIFANTESLNVQEKLSVEEFFAKLKEDISSYFKG